VNRFGRKGGRGLRPWLLIPKVLAVCGAFGGTAAAWVVMLTLDNAATHESVVAQAHVVQRLINWLVYPCVAAAALLGVALLTLHGKPLLRMRWLWLKLIVVILALPIPVRMAYDDATWLVEADSKLNSAYPAGGALMGAVHLSIALMLWALVIWLGRHKPRLGQRPRPMEKRDA